MPERLLETLTADSHGLYDILVNEKGSIIIRECDEPRNHITLSPSIVPLMIATLRMAAQESARGANYPSENSSASQ
jgi:hypothetical protein